MKYDLKQIQKELERTFAIKFQDDMFVDNKCITNITNNCELNIYIGMYAECVDWVPQREHISFMWGKKYGDYQGYGAGYFTINDVIEKMDSLGYPRRITAEPDQLTLF